MSGRSQASATAGERALSTRNLKPLSSAAAPALARPQPRTEGLRRCRRARGPGRQRGHHRGTSPPAIIATTVATGVRKPRMHGWPLICSGRTVILSYRIASRCHSPRSAALPQCPSAFSRASVERGQTGRPPRPLARRQIESGYRGPPLPDSRWGHSCSAASSLAWTPCDEGVTSGPGGVGNSGMSPRGPG